MSGLCPSIPPAWRLIGLGDFKSSDQAVGVPLFGFGYFCASTPIGFMNTKAHPVRIFIAYSSKDLVFKEEIRKRLNPLKRAGKIEIWDNYDIEAGKDWDAEVREQLDQSEIILLLLSPDALDSDYFYEVEAPTALRRHEAGEAIAVGILLRPCDLKYTPFGDLTKYELLPKKGYPVTDRHWRTFDDAYLTIFREVDVLVEKIEAERDGEKSGQERLEKERREEEETRHKKAAQEAADKKRSEEVIRLVREKALLKKVEENNRPKRAVAQKVGIYDILQLNDKLIPELRKIAKALGVQKISSWTKQELIFEILDEQARREQEPASILPSVAVHPQNGQVRRDAPDSPTMIFVEGGTFIMGSNEHDSEKPIHPVTVPSFWMGQYPVTFDEYDAFCNLTGREKIADEGWGRGLRPVINVSWEDGKEYCEWLSMITGKQYRLPSEAEWEFAARGGGLSKGFKFAGSNDLNEVGWHFMNSGGKKSHPVGEKKANELGLYDMSGNVREWCEDVWQGDYKGAPADGSAWVSGGNEKLRVLRGGSWGSNYGNCLVSVRSTSNARNRGNYVGFRLAQDA